jgi:glycosyltransferase involved in cell wall biosynthesis
MPSQHVTFIIATYKRVDALRSTLQSLLLQHYQDWSALVIGDCCDDETADVIRSLGDSRIRYYNFPERFGEQSGPNSFGLHLASGDFVSFLNHDDIALGDHLDYSLQQIAAQDSDFHIGMCADARKLAYEDDGDVVPVFTQVRPPSRDLRLLILRNPWLFEPCSFWVIRSSYARAVGPWNPSSSLWRTPLHDWLMRAWRLQGKFSFGDKVTGLRFLTQNLRKGSPIYTAITPEHEYMIKRFQTESPEMIRRCISRQIEESRQRRAFFRSGLLTKSGRAIQARTLAYLYLWLGLDPVNLISYVSGRPKGKLHKRLLKRRTGENFPKMQDIRPLLEAPEDIRVL